MSRPQDVRIKEAGHLLKEAGGVGCFFLFFFFLRIKDAHCFEIRRFADHTIRHKVLQYHLLLADDQILFNPDCSIRLLLDNIKKRCRCQMKGMARS